MVDGKEVDAIDPVIAFRFSDKSFSIITAFNEYEQPLEDFPLWRICALREEGGGNAT